MHLFDIHTHHSAPLANNVEGHTVGSIVNVLPSNYHTLAMEANEMISCGIHPWYTNEIDDNSFILLSNIVAENRVVAIGEAGLDKMKGADIDVQKKIFCKQIELSEQLQKPIIVHCVKAWEELTSLYKEYNPRSVWIIHGFRGKPQQVEQLLKLGIKISIGDKFNIDTIREIPQDSLFLETDISNIPIYNIYRLVAHSLNIDINDLSKSIACNVKNTFSYICR